MRTILGVTLLALASWTGAYAQAVAGFGGITGTVTDSSANDGLPDATLILTNESLGIKRTFLASDDGIFDMPALVPASGYGLKVTRKGYTPRTISNITVPVGDTLNLIVPMDREGSSVKSEFKMAEVEDNKNVISMNVTPEQLESLPSPSRVLSQFVLLAPAVTEEPRTGVIAFHGEKFTNSVLVDGNDATNTYVYSQPGIAPQLPLDAVVEMQTLSGVWPAEFGHAAGGIVNIATRSGTNGIHGDGYEYYASHDWTAGDRFAPGFQDGIKQNQAGGSLGGSIWPNKVFGFVNFDALNSSGAGLFRVSNQLLTNPEGTAILASNCKATPAQCTAAINFLNPLINVTVPHQLDMRSGVAKFDWRPNQFNSVTIEGNAMHRKAPDGILNAVLTPNSGPGQDGNLGDETRYVKAGYTRTVSESMLNEARVSWFKDRISLSTDPKLLPSTGLLGLNIAGTPFGANPTLPETQSEQRYQLLDNFTLTTGSNSLKLGVDYERVEDSTYQPWNVHGTYDYPSLTLFADDFTGNTKILKNYNQFSQGFGNAQTNLKPRVWAAYAQDTWKVNQRFTITAGLHWEEQQIPQPINQNTPYYQTGSIGYPKTDFSPRLGLAYRIDDKTVARVGIGTYYQPYPGELMRLLYTWNGIYQSHVSISPLQAGSPVFPVVFGPTAGLPTGTQVVAFAATKFKNPYTEQGSVEIERSLYHGVSLTLGYIDIRGNKLWTAADQLAIDASVVNKTYVIQNTSGVQTGTYTSQIFTYKAGYAHAYQVENEGESRYKGVDAQLHAQLKYGVTFHTSYTWEHSQDDVSGRPLFQFMSFLPATTIPGDFASDRGPSSLDQRQRAVMNLVWAPRLAQGQSGAERYLLDGWQFSAIATLATGLPETPLVVVNGQQFNGTIATNPSTLNGSGGWERVPFEGVNSLRTEGEHIVDARITKGIYFTDRVRAMVMFEAFNALNSQYATSVNTIAYSATAGVVRAVPGVGDGTSSYNPVSGTNARRLQIAFRVVF